MNESLFQSLSAELRRGTQILAVLSMLDKTQYGYSLLQDLTDKKVNIEAGTLYPLLRRLETQGLLTSEWDTTESRPRKYYMLSSEGKIVFELLKKEWADINREMSEILGGNE